MTVNTDFAETEVDVRQTNLTRFPLFFPEKRAFFLEGSDIFEFGLGSSRALIPFFSRRIGLVAGREVPLRVGAKVSGRAGGTNFGLLAVRTGSVAGLVPAADMAVLRVQQNVLRESSVGFLATAGDPLGRRGAWTAGVDLTYQTSHLLGDKNFLLGVWGLVNEREDLQGDKTAVGFKIDYPNDVLDLSFTYARIGDAFDPSLGFVPRRAMQQYRLGAAYERRPSWSWLRTATFETFATLITDLQGRWESYRVFTAPVNLRFESGDGFEFNVVPTGDRFSRPFETASSCAAPTSARSGRAWNGGSAASTAGRCTRCRAASATPPTHCSTSKRASSTTPAVCPPVPSRSIWRRCASG